MTDTTDEAMTCEGLRVLAAAGWAGWAVQAACAPRRLAGRSPAKTQTP